MFKVLMGRSSLVVTRSQRLRILGRPPQNERPILSAGPRSPLVPRALHQPVRPRILRQRVLSRALLAAGNRFSDIHHSGDTGIRASGELAVAVGTTVDRRAEAL